MLKRFFGLCFLLASATAGAQYGVGGGGAPAPQAADTVMPASKIYVDVSSIPNEQAAFNTIRSHIVCTGVYDSGSPACTDNSGVKVPNRYTTGLGVNNSGSFRVLCRFSHASFDDPIVWPGQAARTHLHQFFGNTTTKSASDLANMATIGNSTCTGGILNRSGYWAPTLVYHRPGNVRDGEVTVADHANFYYKIATGYASDTGGFGGTAARWAPAGFRMIAGSSTSTAAQSGFIFDCFKNGVPLGAFPGYRFNHIPTTAESDALGGCDDIMFGVPFPECWNGVDLDSSPSHAAHIAYASPTLGCTNALFPTLFPSISLNIHHTVVSADLDYFRLSSDPSRATSTTNGCTVATNYCAGFTLHSDWVNGWDQTTQINGWSMSVTEAILRECYMIANPLPTQHSDCHDHLLGSPLNNGTYLVTDDWWSLY